MAVLLNRDELAQSIETLARQIVAYLPHEAKVALIGIRSRGEVLARRLTQALAAHGVDNMQFGVLDITLYRDDLAEKGPAAIVRKTEIDFDINGLWVLLIDDVLYTGRSVRAALTALNDLGRPRAIRLVVLVDRPGRELPIQADYVGVRLQVPDQHVMVRFVESDDRDCVEIE
jgi:pyrimidine operon attenuation protein/uracil phosphoribosyltransferase